MSAKKIDQDMLGEGWRQLSEGEPLLSGDGFMHPHAPGQWISYECRPDIFRGAGKPGSWYHIPTNDTAHTYPWRRKIDQPRRPQHQGAEAMSAHKITDREPDETPKVENTRDCLRCEGSGNSPTNKGICGACGGRGYVPCSLLPCSQSAAPTERPGETPEQAKKTLEDIVELRAQPTPEAAPMWAKEAAKEIFSKFVTASTDTLVVQYKNEIAAIIARHAPPPVGEVTDSAMLEYLLSGGEVYTPNGSGFYTSRLHYPVTRAAILAAMRKEDGGT